LSQPCAHRGGTRLASREGAYHILGRGKTAFRVDVRGTPHQFNESRRELGQTDQGGLFFDNVSG
jgi:hypothetical protein